MTQQVTSPTATVVVWGGGSGGVAAALQAARAGASTLLLTPGAWLGGMVSAAGVCAPDGNELTPWQTGLWGALLRALAGEEADGLDQNWVSCFGYRPQTAERILRRWVAAEPLLTWLSGCRLLEVERQGDRITSLRLEQGGRHGAGDAETFTVPVGILIDGSDRGDLFPLAGAPFRLGWEAREQWQEPSAPSLADLESDPFFRRQPIQSPTWVVMGQLASRRLASGRIATPSATNALPAPFERATEAFGLERTITYGRLPGGLVMLNWPLHGNDWHQGLERAFEADGAPSNSRGRTTGSLGGDPGAELATEMKAHSLAFAAALEQASGGWLTPAAVFPNPDQAAAGALNGRESLALMPYWREGRRLVGLDLVLEQHLLPLGDGPRIAPLRFDSQGRPTAIAVGNYANDHHYPGPDWPLAPKSCRWGGRWSGTPFTIPYGALVSAAIVNLLAADKCCSVSHMANGATRLQPLVLNLGQAAGMAAALCLNQGIDPAELPVRQLQDALLRDPNAPAGPMPLWDTPWHHPHWRERQNKVLDDPSLLDQSGRLAEPTLNMAVAPSQPHEQLFEGLLVPDRKGGYELQGGNKCWPVITLEPALNDWLLTMDKARPVKVIGCLNPWGPWLRVSRLAE